MSRVPTPSVSQEIAEAQITPSRVATPEPQAATNETSIEEDDSIEYNIHLDTEGWQPNHTPILRKLHRLPNDLVNVKSMYWFGTHNSEEYIDTDELEEVCHNNIDIIKYVVMFKETAPTTGHVHYHSLLVLNKQARAHVCIELDPSGSFEKVKGQLKTAYKYVSKDGQKYFEWGTIPQQLQDMFEAEEKQARKRSATTKTEQAWRALVQRAKAGDQSIRDTQLYARFRSYFDDILTARHEDIIYEGELKSKNIWIHGPAGTGKSRLVWQYAKDTKQDVYVKNQNKWWDGYDNQRIVLIDDAGENIKLLASHIKNWGDRYPFTAEVKGGTRRINSAQFNLVVTSNYSIRELFNPTDAEAIERRFDILLME